jgi:hypothetical protein
LKIAKIFKGATGHTAVAKNATAVVIYRFQKVRRKAISNKILSIIGDAPMFET